MTTQNVSLDHLEVCVDRVDAALAAQQAGATRIELNAALVEDGLTPSLGVCKAVRDICNVPIIAMVRPHNSGFVYSPADKASMLYDVEHILPLVDGVAIGALTQSSEIDVDFLQQVCATRDRISQRLGRPRGELQLVMHRAFDCVVEQISGAETLFELGFQRILSSGGAETAESGLVSLARLIAHTASRIEILPGCGVRALNAERIATNTGAKQLHGSFRIPDSPWVDQQQIASVAALLR